MKFQPLTRTSDPASDAIPRPCSGFSRVLYDLQAFPGQLKLLGGLIAGSDVLDGHDYAQDLAAWTLDSGDDLFSGKAIPSFSAAHPFAPPGVTGPKCLLKDLIEALLRNAARDQRDGLPHRFLGRISGERRECSINRADDPAAIRSCNGDWQRLERCDQKASFNRETGRFSVRAGPIGSPRSDGAGSDARGMLGRDAHTQDRCRWPGTVSPREASIPAS